MPDPQNPQPVAPAELQQQRAAEQRGDPFVVYRDARDTLVVLSLLGTWDRVTIGRNMAADLPLMWDPQVSTVHAQLERLGEDWVLVDDGLSRNGSYLNGERVAGRRRLDDQDELRFGATRVVFHAPFQLRQETVIRGTADS